MKYSDLISLQDYFHPVFNLQNEAQGYWKQFIPTKQFEKLLEKTLDAVSSNLPANRKSIWVQGTFGTGKSHAGSVIKHLLCDEITEINEYIDSRIENPSLKNRLSTLRNGKHYFPVVLSGVEGAYNPHTFSLTLERTIKETLRKAGHQINVKSDFEKAIDLIENKCPYLQELIDKTDELRIIAKTKEEIINKLKVADIELYLVLEEALSKKYSVQLSSEDISQWLSEVETEIRNKNIADGLLIFWDEFTSVMDTISSGLINVLQKIAELAEKQNVYLFLINHKESNKYSENDKDISKMKDRFHIIRYQMESVATYRIMAASIRKADETKYNICRYNRMNGCKDLILYLTDNESQQSANDIENLFPMHPYTAFLCSTLSNQIGSTNRSVFEFLYDEKRGFKKFLQDETAFEENRLLTADCFWDFFIDKFIDNSSKYGFVTDVYIRHKENVVKKGLSYEKVFKGILLFNAMKEILGGGDAQRSNPTTENIKKLFILEPFENELDIILEYFHVNQIVTKDPSGNFLINASTLPHQEISVARQRGESEYKDILKILSYNAENKTTISSEWFDKTLIRQAKLYFLSSSADELQIISEISKGIRENKNLPYLQIALFFAMNEIDKQSISKLIQNVLIKKDDFQNVVFVVFNEPLETGNLQLQNFIDYVAQSQVSNNHRLTEQAISLERNAKQITSQWINRLKQGNYNLYFRENTSTGVTNNVAQYINQNVGYKIFSSGIEIMPNMRNRPMTFFKAQSSKTSAEGMLTALNRDGAEAKFSGQYLPLKFLLKDNKDDYIIDNDLTLKCDISENHPIVKVQQKVDELMAKVKRQNLPNFHLGNVLTDLRKEPFGLYSNIPNMAILAFALRKYQHDFFKTNVGTAVTPDMLRDIVVDLFKFWNGENNGNNLSLRFGSKEEKELKDSLVEIFHLNQIQGVPELSSIKNVKWAIKEFCTQKAKYPLWSLKYVPYTNQQLINLIEEISDLIQKDETSIDTIKKVLQSIKTNLLDFRLLLTRPNAFEDGFSKFVNSTEDVKIELAWWRELTDYFKEKLQPEIGFWKEDDVKDKIKSFYIQKIKPKEIIEEPQTTTPQMGVKVVGTLNPNGSITSANQPNTMKIKYVEAKIDSSNLPNNLLKYILKDLINQFPETTDFINKKLG